MNSANKLIRLSKTFACKNFLCRKWLHSSLFLCAKHTEILLDDEEFRVLVIPGHTKVPETKKAAKRSRRLTLPPRFKSMPIDQDWTTVWPSAHTFKWSAVPFPVRQGFVERSEMEGISPGKYANAELMKIPNFLHLTPAHVKKHCEALKEFCNEWPKELATDEICDRLFPIEVITRDVVADGSSTRDPRARLVTVQLKLSSLELDYHARDKLLRLAGDRYNPTTDMLTLESERCPLKQQNYDHAMYLLAALYGESWNTEAWESEKTLADMEQYFWDINQSRTKMISLLKARIEKSSKCSQPAERMPAYIQSLPDEPSDEQIVELSEVSEYKTAISSLMNDSEDLATLEKYKNAVKQLLLPTQPHCAAE